MSDLKQDLLDYQDVESVTLTAENVNYGVKNIKILHNINLQFKPNEMVALMGPSGAGKTSLLSVIASRAGGTVEGRVMANNLPVSQDLLKQFSNYIPQDDILIAALTPRETLQFTADLRLPASTTADQRLTRVNQVLKDVSLEGCADTPIGDEQIRGISGGQRKRVSVGQELLTNPSVLLVDECTSGLDSKTAHDVISLLSSIAHRGRTVICSIHQPSKPIFFLFDRLLLLAAGRTVYYGSPGDSISYFTSLGFPLPEHENPPNFYMETLEVKLEGTTFQDEWEKRKEAFLSPWTRLESLDDGSDQKPHSYPTSFASQVTTLLHRGWYLTVRDPRMLMTRIISTLAATVIAAGMFPSLDDTQSGGHDVMSFLTVALMYIGWDGVIQQAIVFPLEKMVVIREYNNGTYYILSYFTSRWLLSFLFQTFYGLVFTAITYPVVHLRFGLDHFLVYLFSMVMVGGFVVGLGLIIGAVSISVMMANILITPNLLGLVMLNGFFVKRADIPVYYKWIYWVDPFNYSFRAQALNQFRGNPFPPCVTNYPGECPYGEGIARGEVLLEQYDIGHSAGNMAVALGLQLLFMIGMAHMGYMVLSWVIHRTRF